MTAERPPGLHHNVRYWPGNEPWVEEGLSRRAWQARQFRAGRKAKKQSSVEANAEAPVTVTWRAPRALHDRFRDYAHATRKTKQAIITDAIERFLVAEEMTGDGR